MSKVRLTSDLADHIHALVDLLQQIAQQARDAFQRGTGDLGRLVAGPRVAAHFHPIDDRERPVAERNAAADREPSESSSNS